MVRAAPDADPGRVVAVLGLPVRRPVIVLNGGTDELSPALSALLRPAMDVVVAVAVRAGAILVTGATDAGVFSLVGAALGQIDRQYVCVGVAPAALTTWPGKGMEQAAVERAVQLEGNHTHFVVVDAAAWGEESRLMMGIVPVLAGGMATVAVLAGGGDVAARELRLHLESGRPVIALEGSGRLADRLAATVRGTDSASEGCEQLAGLADRPDLVDVCDTTRGPGGLQAALQRRLGTKEADRD